MAVLGVLLLNCVFNMALRKSGDCGCSGGLSMLQALLEHPPHWGNASERCLPQRCAYDGCQIEGQAAQAHFGSAKSLSNM